MGQSEQEAIWEMMCKTGKPVQVDAVAGSGKCLGPGTPVLMYDGAVIPVEEVIPGDELMGPDSKPRKVLSVSGGRGPLRRITPIKGDPWICNDVHVMTLKGTNRKVGQIIDIPLDRLEPSPSGRFDRDWKLWRTGVDFPQRHYERRISSYLAGVWLGDGTKTLASFSLGRKKIAIVDYIQAEFAGTDMKVTVSWKEDHNCWLVSVGPGQGRNGHWLRDYLIANFIGPGNERRIPDAYLLASRTKRRALLAGLLDTDGYQAGGYFEITCVDRSLSDQVLFLARSLGLAAYRKPKWVKLAGWTAPREYQRITISGDFSEYPFLRHEIRPRKQIKRVDVTGWHVEDAGVGSYYGFTLDGDGRFLLGDFTVTHNTHTIKEAVRRIGDKCRQTILAFNKPVADETKLDLDRMGLRNATSSTIHSVGLRMVMLHFDRRPRVGTKRFDLIRRQAYLQRNDWGASNRVLSHAKNCLIGPGEVTPDLVESHATRAGFKYTNAHKVAGVVNRMLEIALDGSKMDEITFDDMIYIPAMLNLKLSGPGIIYVDEAQDLNAAQHKIVSDCFDGARVNAVGDPYQCQPAGTQVLLTGGRTKAIEEIVEGDEVVSYNSRQSYFTGLKSQGRRVLATGKRLLSGEILRLTAGPYSHEVTYQHRCHVRMAKRKGYAVYVMQRGSAARVGVCSVRHGTSFGPAMRARQEKADRVWVLRYFDNFDDARSLELVIAYIRGLPQVCFQSSTERGVEGAPQERLDQFWKAMPDFTERLYGVLHSYGKMPAYPVWELTGEWTTWGVNKTFMTQACNLQTGWFEVCCFNGDQRKPQWEVVEVEREAFSGYVYSLSVEPAETGRRLYIANGIVTGNSIYGWRGAAKDSMAILQKRLNQTVLPITVTRRCPHSVVATANTLVPHLRAMESAVDGLVDLAEELPLERYEGSTLVVCRRNAPLLGECLRLIRAGVPAFLNDGEFSETLTNLYSTIMAKTQPSTRDDAVKALFDYQRMFIMQAEERYEDPEDRLDAIKAMEDRVEAIAAVLDLVDSPGAVPAKIENLFSRGSGGVCFSSIHRAKGLEADRVFILEPAALKVDTQEQVNLAYVAMTRAKRELYFVGGMPEWL